MYKFLPTYYAYRRRPLALILEQVCEVCRVSVEEVRGRGRGDYIVAVRVVFSKIASKQGYTVSEIGREINRSHSTTHYHIQYYKPTAEFDYFYTEFLKRHPQK